MMFQDATQQQTTPVIAFITDFGLSDGYVASMKGVLLSICPEAKIIDITHDISPQNIYQAAFVLLSTLRYLPKQTIVVAVVDPGVGSSRKPIAIQTTDYTLVGPDNGIFSFVLKQLAVEQMVILDNTKYHLTSISSTFHGRDIFSPVAAYIGVGTAIEKIGTQLYRVETLIDPQLHIDASAISGEVIYIDHFGNLVTSIGHLGWDADDMLQFRPVFLPTYGEGIDKPPIFGVEACSIEIKEHVIESLSLTYSAATRGRPTAIINSAGHLEIAVNHGNAAQQLGIEVGEPVILRFD